MAPWCMAAASGPITTSLAMLSRTTSRPISSCAGIVSAPSSPITPSTAQDRRPLSRVIAARAFRPARIDSGLALKESLRTVTPSAR